MAFEENQLETRPENIIYRGEGSTHTRGDPTIREASTCSRPEEVKLSHPAMFSVELCKRLIEIYTWPGEVMLDSFMGSGTFSCFSW